MPKLTPLRWFVLLSIVAIVLALGLPPDHSTLQQLHISSATYRVAIAALLIPYALIWYAGFYAFAKLQEYSSPLKGAKDGEAFRKLTVGMGTLAFALVVPTIISLVLTSIASHNASFKTASIIISNYLGLFPGMVAFLILLNGSRELLRTTKGGATKLDIRWHAPWFLLLTVTFSYLTIKNKYEFHPYHLPLILLITTFIVPYLYGWLVGLLSAYDLHLYAKTVSGALYRKGISQFAHGIFIGVIGSIAIQFVNITIAQRYDKSVGAIVLLDYLLLLIVGWGLLLIALGTKKLALIEKA